MVHDVLLNKVSIIERCLARVEQEYRGHEAELESNFTRQDSIVLNLQRACEASIDAAMHLVRVKRLGLPQESREAFALLYDAGVIDAPLKTALQAMVGFRNVAVHDYRKLNLDVVRSIIENHLEDFRAYCRMILKGSFS
ncbi:type VII toxin-antitoxin system HepT family RNase toxin [Trichloromonas sp.]|uniref:type VII toxin-antitoxin system HepT family RNase toxin n=1 Tax=Trichloromonas sp. TaxID=3069249 RepID=UPI002A3FB965|nr:DUF86 domain-containing protein [Trichloromonas sp.]